MIVGPPAWGIKAIVADLSPNDQIHLRVQVDPRVAPAAEQKWNERGADVRGGLNWCHGDTTEGRRIAALVMMLVHPAVQECTHVAVSESILHIPPGVHVTVDEPEVQDPPVQHRHCPKYEPQREGVEV